MNLSPLVRPAGRRTATALEEAILKTLAYGDLFDHPLTAAEIHRYLLGCKASREEVGRALKSDESLGELLERREDYYALRGRSALVEKRKARAVISRQLWPKAHTYARALSRVPGVKMIAVTGSLVMDNAESGGDVDFLVVTEKEKLWRTRLCIIAYAKWIHVTRGERVCVNFLITEHNLAFTRQNDYTAREVTQMLPLHGYGVYRELISQNSWVLRHLPNFIPRGESDCRSIQAPSPFQSVGARVLSLLPENLLYRWQVARILRQKGSRILGQEEVILRRDCFKGHLDGHGARIERSFKEKLRALGLS